MNPTSLNGSDNGRLFSTHRFDDFDVSWVGPMPLPQLGICFGSASGQVMFTDYSLNKLADPDLVNPSKEAINGVAFWNGWLAASTRADVTMGSMQVSGSRYNTVGIPVGAHGIVATPNGMFVSPMGRTGLMIFRAGSAANDPVYVLQPKGASMYFCRAVAQLGRDGIDLIAIAARKGGLVVGETSWGHPTYVMRGAASTDVDVVDICLVRSEPSSPSIVALAFDGTLLLVRDALHDPSPLSLKFNTIGGTPYRVLSAGEDIVVLTSKGVFLLGELASRLTGGFDLGAFTTQIFAISVEAVDAAVIADRWLLIVTPDEVLRFDLEAVRAGKPTDQRNEMPISLSRSWTFNDVNSTARQLARA